MFNFFTNKKWFLWSWLGSIIILGSLWVQVKIDVKINEWFGAVSYTHLTLPTKA